MENLLKSKPKAKIQTKNKGKFAKIQTEKAATYLQATALIHYSILCSNTLLPFNKYFILNYYSSSRPQTSKLLCPLAAASSVAGVS